MQEVAWWVGDRCRSRGPDGVGGGGSTYEPCVEAEGRQCSTCTAGPANPAERKGLSGPFYTHTAHTVLSGW